MLEDKLNLTEEIKKETIEKLKQRTISYLHETGILDHGKSSQKEDNKKEAAKGGQRQYS